MWTGVCQKRSCGPSRKKDPSTEGQPSHLIQRLASSIHFMHMIYHDSPWLISSSFCQVAFLKLVTPLRSRSISKRDWKWSSNAWATWLEIKRTCDPCIYLNMYPHPHPRKTSTSLSFSFLEVLVSTHSDPTHPATGSLVKRSNKVIRLAEMVTTTAEAAVTVAPQGAASPEPLFSTERSPRMDLGPTLFKTCSRLVEVIHGQHHCRFEHENNLVQNCFFKKKHGKKSNT